jgi:ribose/xylose/arabinose/galactoside ABC-type transport system permease subunit
MKSITRQEWYGALVAVLVLGALLTLASPYFLTTGNLSNILVQASVIALLAGGQTFVILTGGVDLAVGALTALAGAIAGHLMIKLGINPYTAILAALAIGAAVGVFNGYLVAFVGIPSFIVTLGGLTLWRGLAFDATGGFDNSGMPDPLPFIGYGNLLGAPMPIWITGGLLCGHGLCAFKHQTRPLCLRHGLQRNGRASSRYQYPLVQAGSLCGLRFELCVGCRGADGTHGLVKRQDGANV